tara:strand:+ start:829 stop:1509 length:681 start_codon:yes stop_codon:yes gene_type:complete
MTLSKCNLIEENNDNSQELSNLELSKIDNIQIIDSNTNELINHQKNAPDIDEQTNIDYEIYNNNPKYINAVIYFYQVFIHVFIFSIFESFFFWLYITKEEDQAILNQIEDVVLVGNLFCTNINDDVDFSSLYDYQKDKRDTFNNKVPLNNTIMLNTYLFCVIILLNFLLKVGRVKIIKFNYKILKHQSSTFILLFVYEYLFFRNIIYNYLPDSSNKIVKKIFEKCI